MNPDEIPEGSLCVLDTNVLIYAGQGMSLQARRLLERISNREIQGILPQPIWQELTHRLMVTEALELGLITPGNPARQLAAKPDVVRKLSLYREKVHTLAGFGLGYEPCQREDFVERAFKFQEQYGLLTNDSLLLAVAVRLQADALVTADMALQVVRELPVYMPSDVRSVRA